jgi:hypothetical protein
MDALILARWQFALTTIFHFFFVPLTIGLSFLVAVMETIYVGTGQQVYKDMTKFWGKLLLINFAMGVVTGIVQEFQFGMNWSEYSRFVGDVFGAPLAVEALLAFFVESTFLAVWLFGWDMLPKRLHLLTIWLVALATTISAMWILAANSFMQQPVGFVVRGGRAEMTDFFALILNPHLWVQFPHTTAAAFATAAFFVLGISAYHLARALNTDMFRRSFQIAGIIGLVAIGLTIFYGHRQARYKAEVQPMKIAAVEGLFESENPASFSLLTIGDLRQRREVFAIRIPRLLSLLAYRVVDRYARSVARDPDTPPVEPAGLQPAHGRSEGHERAAGSVSRPVWAGRLHPAARAHVLELSGDGRGGIFPPRARRVRDLPDHGRTGDDDPPGGEGLRLGHPLTVCGEHRGLDRRRSRTPAVDRAGPVEDRGSGVPERPGRLRPADTHRVYGGLCRADRSYRPPADTVRPAGRGGGHD